MDSNIRTLLTTAQKSGGRGWQSLQEAYGLLKHVAETKPTSDAPEAFSQDLYILCAETAFQQYSQTDMAKECLKMYFMKTPPSNQFLVRAYLCQAQLLAPASAENPAQLEKALVYLIKAIELGKENNRYHFLVYNASVLYWRFCRPFLKPNYRHYLASSLQQLVKALDDIDDKDYSWRAQLMIALIECHMDAGRRSDATTVATTAAVFIKKHVPSLYKKIFGLMVRHQLVDNAKFQKELKTSPELHVYYRICRLKLAIDQRDTEVVVAEEMTKILQQASGQLDLKQAVALTKEKSGTFDDLKRSTSRQGSRQSTLSTTSVTRLSMDSPDKPYLLLELARLALQQDLAETAQQALEHIKLSAHLVKDPSFFLEVEFLQDELMVRSLAERQESYQKPVVEVRLAAIKKCDDALQNAMRVAPPGVIQAGCVTQWTLCLPLLQPNLRHHVRKPLTVVTQALENIQSLLIQLRCQVHMEVSKCEEDKEQIQVALEHLTKALALDDGAVYNERLQLALHRLQLRAELYQQPERPEDAAAMIIEQARKADSGTMRMKRSLLVKAGQVLAPDAFLLVLDSENETKVTTAGKGLLDHLTRLAARAALFQKNIKKAEGHLRRLGNENEKERAALWGDLAKTARKQEVWDVCRIAARFCLLYDDGRWKVEIAPLSPTKDVLLSPRAVSKGKSVEKDVFDMEPEKSVPDMSKLSTSRLQKESSILPEKAVSIPLYEIDLIRMMAEVNFINGEALIHFLRSEGVELGVTPTPPVDKRKHPKGYVVRKVEDEPEWNIYCDWLETISQDALQCFVRAIMIGQELQEAWLVCCAAAYVWNYHNHTLSEGRHKQLINILSVVLEGLKKVGHAGETSLFVNVCTALTQGLLQPWISLPPPRLMVQPSGITVSTHSTGGEKPAGRKSPSRRKGSVSKPKGPSVISISSDAAPTLKQATDVCEYAMAVTNGDTPQDVVPIATRQSLLETWVAAKQLQQSQITRTFGAEDEVSVEGQQPMTRAIVATRMLELTNNGVMEFKEVPTLANVVEMVEGCHWSDHLVELQLWTRLTFLTFEAKEHALVVTCAKKALAFAESGTQPKGKKLESHKYMVEQELLSYSSCLYGQSLMENAHGKILTRRDALHQFLGSARFACNAGNEELVMLAARQYWNTCLPLIRQKMERELLKEPLALILQCIAETADKNKYKRAKDDDDTDSEVMSHQPSVDVTDKPTEGAMSKKSDATLCGAVEDDLTLVAYMYGLLFQCYADKSKWQEGLEVMDQAIANMPKTNHRLLIFKHLVVVKATLAMDVTSSILRFKDESEDSLALMWRKVALSSSDQSSQMLAYQSAIEALTLRRDDWLKVDLLIEFGQWLYCNEFPLEDATDQFHWAIDILLNMRLQTEKEAPSPTVKSRKSRKSNLHSSVSKLSKTSHNDNVKKMSVDMGQAKPEPAVESSKASIVSDTESSFTTDLIPTEKKITIGCVLTNTVLTLSDLCDIRQLEVLLRLHTLLAEVTGTSSPHHTSYCLLAHACLMKLWQVSVQNSSPYLKDLPKKDVEPAGKGSAKKDKGKKDVKEKEVVKEKPKRKGALDALPASLEDWAVYDAPDEVIEAFKIEALKTSGINANTFTKPSLTLVSLNVLVDQLKRLCLSHLTLPVLAMEDLLARDLIKSTPLKSLIHLRAMEVCIELNLMSGVAFHQPLANYKLNEMDQARAREQAAQWKDRQNQIMKEELRMQTSMTNIRKKEDAVKDQAKLEVKVTSTVHLGRKVGAILLRDVWTDTAEVLLHMALYQSARELLNEAFLSATAFDDKPLVARILYLFAKLSFAEAQYGQAVNLCIEAQKQYDGEEMFWYETTILMVDSILKDETLQAQERTMKTTKIVQYALDVFTEILRTRPNRQDVVGFIIAKLEAKLAMVQQVIIKQQSPLSGYNKELVSRACKELRDAADKLLSLGYYRNTVECLKGEAQLFTMLAHHQEAALATKKHDYYIQALQCLEEALAICEAQLYNFQSLLDVADMRSVCPSQQRDTAVLKLELSELMLEMLQLHVEQERREQKERERKGSIVRVVEDVIRETPVYTPMEQQWEDLTKTMADKILVQLSSVHLLAADFTELKARALLDTGHCLRLLHQLHTPDPTAQWNAKPLSLQLQHAPEPPLEEVAEESVGGDSDLPSAIDIESLTTSKDRAKFTRVINAAKRKHDTSLQFLTQAMDCLSQVVTLGINKQLLDLVGRAALELVECIGEFDPSLASQYLALHQSCEASRYLEGVLTQALTDPTQSQTAALIHQRANLHADNITTNLVKSPLMKNIQQRLDETSKAWSRLKISPQHLEMTKDFPPNFNFVILQHSPDRCWLYGAVLEKAKGAAAGAPAKGSLKGALATSSRAQVVRVATSPTQLSELLERLRWYKYDVMQLLLKIECQHAQLAQREKMLAGLQEKKEKSSSQNLMDEDIREEEHRFQEEFQDLLVAMETYLAPIFEHLGPMLSQTSVVAPANPKDNPKDHKDHQVAAPANNECIILLVDQHLMQLPLEALQLLQMDHVSSVSREISLQMMFNKMHSSSTAEELEEKGKKEKGGDKTKPPPRIPGLRDANKKQVKIIPLERPVPVGILPVDTTSFRYIVDPHLDCSETEVKKPVEVFNNIMEEHSQQFTPRWLGILGNEHTPSQGEYEIYLAECGAFIFYGMERFLGYIPPHKVAATNMPDCQLMVLLDQTQTSSSFSRQAKIDVHKTTDRLALEKPVETAMLLSLAGVNCVLINQWHCSLRDNADKLDSLMKELLSGGSTTGHAVHTLLTPQPVTDDENELVDKGNEKPGSGENSRKNSHDSSASSAPVMNRQRFNLVCYGLPNIIVAQLSKV